MVKSSFLLYNNVNTEIEGNIMISFFLLKNILIYIVLTFFILFLLFNEKLISLNIKSVKSLLLNILRERTKSKGLYKFFSVFINLLEAFFIAFILVAFIQKFYLGNFLIPTGSMIPVINPRDRVFANMFQYKFSEPQMEDIVVFQEPINNELLFTKRLMARPGDRIYFENNTFIINNKVYDFRNYTNPSYISKEWTVPKKGDILEIYIDKIELEENIDKDNLEKYLIENIIEERIEIKFILNGEETGKLMDLLHYEEISKVLIRGEKIKLKLGQDYYFVLGDNTEASYDSRAWGFVSREKIKGKVIFRFWPLNSIGRI